MYWTGGIGGFRKATFFKINICPVLSINIPILLMNERLIYRRASLVNVRVHLRRPTIDDPPRY